MEPLVPRHKPDRPYPTGLLLVAVAVGVTGWAPRSNPFDERPPAPVLRSELSPADMQVAAKPAAAPVARPAAGVQSGAAPPPRPTSAPEVRTASVSETAGPRGTAGRRERPEETAQAGMLGEIVRMKAVLRLSPDQESYWRPVEAVLRDIAREQAAAAQAGRGTSKPGQLTIGQAEMQRLSSVAFPLVFALREDQKRDAMRFARAMGLDSIAAAF